MATKTTSIMSQSFSESQIVYEDNHMMVINKKAGQLVQGDKTGDLSLLELIKDFIKKRDDKPGNVFLGLVHRIDRPTSGLVIYAKTSKALSRLTQMVKNREVKKTYWAVVGKEMIPNSQRLPARGAAGPPQRRRAARAAGHLAPGRPRLARQRHADPHAARRRRAADGGHGAGHRAAGHLPHQLRLGAGRLRAAGRAGPGAAGALAGGARAGAAR